MKKFLAVILSFLLLLSVTGCGNDSSQNGPVTSSDSETESDTTDTTTTDKSTSDSLDEKGLIGFSVPTLGLEFFEALDESFHAKFEGEGYEVVTVSCELNAATQVSDIENLMTMGVDTIFAFVVDAEALTDTLVKARQEGITVIPIATNLSNRDAYDKIMGTDQYATGVACAEIASDWVNETFPDAADGSIDIAITSSTESVEAIKRSNGLEEIADINSKVNIVEIFDTAGAPDVAIKAQEYAEIMTSKYPDIKLVLTYGSADATAVNEVYMKQAWLDKTQFAVFGVDVTEVVLNNIKKSKDGESVSRGTISFGIDIAGDMWKVFTGEYDQYMDENGYINTPIDKIIPDNVDEFLAKMK